MVHLERKGMVEAIYKLTYFIICRQKNTGKMARAQGKDREFGINWSVATCSFFLVKNTFHTYKPIFIQCVVLYCNCLSLFSNISELLEIA